MERKITQVKIEFYEREHRELCLCKEKVYIRRNFEQRQNKNRKQKQGYEIVFYSQGITTNFLGKTSFNTCNFQYYYRDTMQVINVSSPIQKTRSHN